MKLPLPEKTQKRVLWLLLAGLIIAAGAAMLVGRYPQPGALSISDIQKDPLAKEIIINLRIPRIIAAILVGMVLSASGLVFQQTFSNPLVEPGFLGITPGAAFGAALSIILFTGNTLAIQLGSVAFAFLGLWLSILISTHIYARNDRMSLIFSGIIISALFSSGLGVLKYLADPYSQLPEITFWLLGGLWSVIWNKLLPIIIPVLISIIVLIAVRWRLNLLGLDDEVSHSIGFDVKKEKRLYLFIAVLGTAMVTSIAGIVNWVGLIIPTITRLIFGGNLKHSLPATLLIGGFFVLFCDTLGRVFFAGEIPLGILTSLFGAGLFLLISTKGALKE